MYHVTERVKVSFLGLSLIFISTFSLATPATAQNKPANNYGLNFSTQSTEENTVLTAQVTNSNGPAPHILHALNFGTLSWKIAGPEIGEVEFFPTLMKLIGTPLVNTTFV